LKKAYRIKKNIEIETIIRQKNNVGNNYFVIYQSPSLSNLHFRFAVSVPKKYGNAVKRNLMKRRVREIVRQTEFISQCDFLVIVKTKAKELDFSYIKDNLIKLFARAKIIKG